MKKPRLSLVVIRSWDIERSARFYSALGLHLEKHRHGNGPEHFASEYEGSVFEIYPRQEETDSTGVGSAQSFLRTEESFWSEA
jgi:lactoylglutathione lyase